MAVSAYQEDGDTSKPAKRIRWATKRMTGQSGNRKRQSVMDRFHRRGASDEKGRPSTATPEGTRPGEDGEDDAGSGTSQRRVFFNVPLPDDAKDEDGHPIASFERNKVRTAKYTALSFVPKNLWFQFHNIANIYFLFIIILGVRLPFRHQRTFCAQLTYDRHSRYLVSTTQGCPLSR